MNYTIPVRALCEFSARCGDLDLRFTPTPTALEGIEGHALVRARRPAGYEKEIALSETIDLDDGEHTLTVRGRADGYAPGLMRIEEIKTFRGRLETMPENHRALHWAQARVYGHLMCRERGLDAMQVALVYYDVDRGAETVLTEDWTAARLAEYAHGLYGIFAQWARQETAHRLARDEALRALAFPFAQMRPGQRQLAEAVYRTTLNERRLLAQAPTGIGKTVGTLFPMLKAMPGAGLDAVYFLTAKTSGRQLALDGMALMLGRPGGGEAQQMTARAENPAPDATPTALAGADAPDSSRAALAGADAPDATRAAPSVRVLELTAREKACEHPDKACHGASCPLARGFYDRLPAARAQAVSQGWMDRAAVRRVALDHSICPYWLGHDLALWADVVVGDYNYYFDTSALLRALAQQRQWRVGLLVDEAHNLVDRARAMYSASLREAALRAARTGAPGPVRRALDGVLRAWRNTYDEQTTTYQAYESLPAKLLVAMQAASAKLGEHFDTHGAYGEGPGQQATGAEAGADLFTGEAHETSHTGAGKAHVAARDDRARASTGTGTGTGVATGRHAQPGSELLTLHFDLLHFLRLAETFGPHSVLDMERAAGETLTLRNMVPAPYLSPVFETCHAAVLFSATLAPHDFYRDILGLPENCGWIDVDTPFSPDQLQVRIARGISTRYGDRAASVAPIAHLMQQQFATRPGNYLSYFSSFEYLAQVADHFAQAYPGIPIWLQSPGMDEAQRSAFLQRFAPAGQGIGFAVLGGAFSEGIDLPGDRLIGAFVSTLGLPQFNEINTQRRHSMHAMFGPQRAYDYTFLYPGLQKVVQAAGRVIRSTTDRGVVHLIDDRYAQSRVRALLPRWWDVR